MANSVARNPIYLDTFSADVTISSNPITVKKIVTFSAAAGDLFYLEDKSGNQVALIVTKTNVHETTQYFGDNGFKFDGLQMDVSDCTGYGANDKVWIYLV